MNIALITDNVDEPSPGLNRYTRRLAEHLMDLRNGHKLTFVHRRDHDFYQGRPHMIVGDGRNRLWRKQMVMPKILSAQKFDLVHDPYHFPPFLWSAPYRKVMTIADLTPLLLDTHSWPRRLAHQLLLKRLARRADHIITISEHTKADVIRHLGMPAERITSVPLAADATLAPVEDAVVLATTRQKYGLPERFLLFVGTIEPRKNVVRLLSAYAQALPRLGDVALVVAGGPGWKHGSVLAALRGRELQGRVLFLGRVPDGDLPALYSLALAFVYPSLYEGFGLPPLEAIQCGTPVVTSNVSSLPEVVGDAALLIDPYSVRDLEQGLVRIVEDGDLRRELRGRGIEQAKRFSWRKCAKETLDVYERVHESLRR